MPERAPARSIYILLLLFLINLMNFFDRTIPAVVLEPIRKEFGLDDTALGILGASFTLIYISSFNMSSERVSAPLSPARCPTCTQSRR